MLRICSAAWVPACASIPRYILLAASVAAALAQTNEWPAYGHDPGGARYSPLTQINAKNVATLRRAWTYHTGDTGNFETTPIVADHAMYFSTQSQKIVSVEPETGKEIWKFDPKSRARELRGVAYWPGNRQIRPRIIFGTADGRLIALDAKTGQPAAGFGDNGSVNARQGVADGYPATTSYAI